jgi:hypothetical protein
MSILIHLMTALPIVVSGLVVLRWLDSLIVAPRSDELPPLPDQWSQRCHAFTHRTAQQHQERDSHVSSSIH